MHLLTYRIFHIYNNIAFSTYSAYFKIIVPKLILFTNSATMKIIFCLNLCILYHFEKWQCPVRQLFSEIQAFLLKSSVVIYEVEKKVVHQLPYIFCFWIVLIDIYILFRNICSYMSCSK